MGLIAESVLAVGHFDAVTGRADRRPLRSRLSGTNGVRRAPELVARAARAVGASPFDAARMEAHIEKLREAVDTADSVEARRQAAARYAVDAAAFYHVLRQAARPSDIGRGVWEYLPAYEPQSFGRLSERGVGLQGCSRACKRAAREGVPGLHNYDLSAAHARFLPPLLHEAGTDCPWLLAYLADPQGKAVYAHRIGSSVGAWKRALYAVIQGAWAPAPSRFDRSEGKLAQVFREDRPHAAAETYARFYAETEELREALRRWHTYLVDEWAPSTSVLVGANGKWYVKNRVGATVALEDLSPSGLRHELIPKLSAFQLQGLEAAVVFRVATAGPGNGFRPVSLEHDGLVTLGPIPDAVVAAAAEGAGVARSTVVLVEKPFGS